MINLAGLMCVELIRGDVLMRRKHFFVFDGFFLFFQYPPKFRSTCICAEYCKGLTLSYRAYPIIAITSRRNDYLRGPRHTILTGLGAPYRNTRILS